MEGEEICAICEESLPEGKKFFYFEDKIKRPACERCIAAMMNIILRQKMGWLTRGDARLILRETLGIKGKYTPLTKDSK